MWPKYLSWFKKFTKYININQKNFILVALIIPMEEFKALNPLYDTLCALKANKFRFPKDHIRTCEVTQSVQAYPMPPSTKFTKIGSLIFTKDNHVVRSPFDFVEHLKILVNSSSQTNAI